MLAGSPEAVLDEAANSGVLGDRRLKVSRSQKDRQARGRSGASCRLADVKLWMLDEEIPHPTNTLSMDVAVLEHNPSISAGCDWGTVMHEVMRKWCVQSGAPCRVVLGAEYGGVIYGSTILCRCRLFPHAPGPALLSRLHLLAWSRPTPPTCVCGEGRIELFSSDMEAGQCFTTYSSPSQGRHDHQIPALRLQRHPQTPQAVLRKRSRQMR